MPTADDLFDEDEPITSEAGPTAPSKPFAHYLRETPPAPISQGTRMLLWAAGVLTLLLFLASVLKMAA
jgi:hypothetical protein